MEEDKERAAARCTHCGEIGIVRIRPDGEVRPLGQSALCECGSDAEINVLDSDHGEFDESV